MKLKGVGGLYIFEQAAKLVKYNRVILDSIIPRGDKTIIWFKVGGNGGAYDVRMVISKLEKGKYLKEWSCTCEHSSFPKGTECSHRIASLVRLVQILGWE